MLLRVPLVLVTLFANVRGLHHCAFVSRQRTQTRRVAVPPIASELSGSESLLSDAQALLSSWAYEFTHDGPFEIVYSDQEYMNPTTGSMTRPIAGFRVTVSGWIGIGFSLANTLWSPTGLVEYTKRGGLGAEEGLNGGLLSPGGYLRNALRRALVPKEQQELINMDENGELPQNEKNGSPGEPPNEMEEEEAEPETPPVG